MVQYVTEYAEKKSQAFGKIYLFQHDKQWNPLFFFRQIMMEKERISTANSHKQGIGCADGEANGREIESLMKGICCLGN
jgi:hypothetical protein